MKFLERDLGEARICRLVLAFVEGSEKGETTTEEIQAFIDWCEEVTLDYYLIKLSAEGKMLVKNQKENYYFSIKNNAFISNLDK